MSLTGGDLALRGDLSLSDRKVSALGGLRGLLGRYDSPLPSIVVTPLGSTLLQHNVSQSQ